MDDDDEIERIRARKLAEMMARVEKKEMSQASSAPVVLTDQNFAGIVSKSKLVLVDFWATWCAPCKIVAPSIEELARQFSGKLTVGKMDVDSNRAIPAQFGIQSIPTILMFKNGQMVDGIVGAAPKSHIEGMVRKWM